MQTIAEPPGAVERYQQTGCHGQGRGQPGNDFAGAEELLSDHGKDVVPRRQAVRAMAQGIEDGCKVGQPSYMRSDDLVIPERTMEPDVDAGRKIKSGQNRRDREAKDIKGAYGVFSLR